MLAPSSTRLCAQVWRDFAKQRRATSCREGSRDLDEKSSDLAKDLSKSSFRAHLVRAAACGRRETTPTCIGSFNSIWGLQGAAPFAFEALKAQIARSRRDLENVPRN